MKKLFLGTLISVIGLTTLYADGKFSDLTSEYFYGKDSKVSVNVKRTIAKDPETDIKTLEILKNDKDELVKLAVLNNLNSKVNR